MSQPEERLIVERYFLSHPAGRILDAPSGNLWLSTRLVSHGFECHAADLYCEANGAKGIEFRKVDLNTTLPYPEGHFDYIACIEGIEHIENTHHLLREFFRVLRPGGKVMITTPNVLNFKSRLRYLLRGHFFGFPHYWKETKAGDHLHLNPVTYSELQFAARRCGLEVEKLHPFPLVRKNWVYAPGAWLVALYNRIGLGLKRPPADYARLIGNVSSRNLLLSEVLIVSLQKPPAPAAGP